MRVSLPQSAGCGLPRYKRLMWLAKADVVAAGQCAVAAEGGWPVVRSSTCCTLQLHSLHLRSRTVQLISNHL